MAHLDALIPTLNNAVDVVSREMVGFIPAVASDMTFERAAKGQKVQSHVTPAAKATDIEPDQKPPNDGDQDIGAIEMEITKARRVPILWTGEERLALDNAGNQFNLILRDQIAQGMRTLVNEVEADLAMLHTKASRAVGVAGVTPFASGLGDTAQALKFLKDNGATGDLQLVIDTTAGANMRTLSQLNKANEANDESLLRRGVLLDVHGFAVRESAQIKSHTAGTSASATTNTTGYAVGATEITLASAGTGTILVGDAISFAGDSNKYIVVAGDTDVSNGGTVVIATPGLRKAIPTSATAITVTAGSIRNMVFPRTAITLATRTPALPKQGDSAIDRTITTDPISGLSFEISVYPGYRQVQYEVSLAWGCAATKPEQIGILLG